MTNRPEPIVEQIEEVLPSDYESSIFKLKKNLQAILGPDVHIHLAASPQLSPARLPSLMSGRPRYRPLRWSELEPGQRKQIENFIPYFGPDDMVRYADTIIVTCPEAEWIAEQRRQANAAAKADGQNIVAQYRQDVSGSGLRVDTKWDDRGGSAPRKRE